jgi:pimeloyl-ACP methyl ester carboxylesterase
VDQEIRFCTASDGVRLAYAKHGHGPPLVKASNWLTHLEFDWESGVWRHWLEALGRTHTVVRYDLRGCGMSDRDVDELSLERWVLDLETVIDAAGVERCSLLGISGGAACALAYAARNPERVDRVIAYGGWASGKFLRADDQRRKALKALIRTGWAAPYPAFRRVFTMMFLPEGTPAQMAWYDELQLRSASPEMAVRLYDALAETDATELLPHVAAPTLVLHASGDLVVPFEEGRRIAATVPSARLITLESRIISCSPTSLPGTGSSARCSTSSALRRCRRALCLSSAVANAT